MELEKEQTLIFTYGTLKRNFPNHHLLQSNSAVTAVPYPLVVGPNGIPFLINLPGAGRRVSGEVYSLSDQTLALVDDLEGVERGHYERLPIRVVCDGEIEGGAREVMGYFAHRGFGDLMWRRVCGGGEKGSIIIGEYTAEEAKGYVRVEERRKGVTFLDEVWRFVGGEVED